MATPFTEPARPTLSANDAKRRGKSRAGLVAGGCALLPLLATPAARAQCVAPAAASPTIDGSTCVVISGVPAETTAPYANPWTGIANLVVGSTAGSDSALTIQNGGTVGGVNTVIGNAAGSSGTVTVSGAGSTFTNSGVNGQYVGSQGTGTLDITDGAVVTDTGTDAIANSAGSTGTATVTGAGSTWTVGSNLNVGYAGNGTLNVSDSAVVNVNGNQLSIGYSGSGSGALNIFGGGAVKVPNGYVFTGIGGTGALSVDGTGSTLTVGGASGGSLDVGYSSPGSMRISGGATVSSTYAYIGYAANGAGTVTIDGAGSAWNVAQTAYTGYNASSTGTLNVSNGASFDAAGTTYIGLSGTGAMNVSSGGKVGSTSAYVGTYANGAVTVDGAGSSWTGDQFFSVGYAGTGTLTVSNGGSVGVPDIYLATTGSGTGTLNVGAAPGSPAVAPGTLDADDVTFGAGTGTLNFNHTGTDYQFTVPLTGTGTVANYAGTTWLAGASPDFSGSVNLFGGTLGLANDASAGTAIIHVKADPTLAYASGVSIANTVEIDAGTTVRLESDGAASQTGAISGAGSVQKTGAGTLSVSAANTYSGTTDVVSGILRAAAPNTFSPNSAVTVGSGAQLDLNGHDQTIPALANNGLVNMGATPGTVLTVNGNYSGNYSGSSAGTDGVINMHTVLGDSSSATDLVHVTGDTAGSTYLAIANAGGTGAQTTGDGIKVVQVDGASAGTFQTGTLEAGAYEYLLYKGGVDDDASSGNWYLRSLFEEPCNGGNGTNGEEVCNGGNGAGPETPAWRPAVPGYVLTPALNLAYGFTLLGTLHTRVGDVPGAVVPDHTDRNGVWGRVGGGNLQTHALDRFAADSSTFYAQFGKDWTLDQPPNGGSTHAGVTVAIGSSSARFNDFGRLDAGLDPRTGTVVTQAQSLGGYWTRYLADGTYWDSVGQLTHYHNRYGDIDGNAPGQDGFGIALSQEVGKPFQIGSTSIAFEPQAQLMYQYLSLGSFSDNISYVSGTHGNALRGRAGFRLFDFNLRSADGKQAAIPWISANIVHDFLPAGQTVVGGTPFTANLSRTWYDLGVGVTATLGERGELYTNLGYSHSMGGQKGRMFYGQAGYRYSW